MLALLAVAECLRSLLTFLSEMRIHLAPYHLRLFREAVEISQHQVCLLTANNRVKQKIWNFFFFVSDFESVQSNPV
jgi:hypothetical protein